MVDGGGAENVAPVIERPIVVIGRYPLEGEVFHAIGAENGGETSFCGADGVVLSRGRDGGRAVLGKRGRGGELEL